MAQSSTSFPLSLDPAFSPSLVRSDSFASNISAQSACSLSRRSRIRSRTRTLTISTSSSRRGKSAGPPASRDVEAFNHPLGQAVSAPPLSHTHVPEGPAPERPPRSPLRASPSPIDANFTHEGPVGPSMGNYEDVEQRRRGRMTEDDAEGKQSKSRKRHSSLPRDAYRMSMLSGQSSPTSPLFSEHSRMHPIPPFNSVREARQHLRNSLVTSHTGSASSIYPPSTSTVSGTTDSLPSPRSLVGSFHDNGVSSVDPDDPDGEYGGFDGDDVSYRLRLLVNNNYFLPPAHSKPSPLDFAPQNTATPKKPTKPSTPTFLDLFRMGKSRTKTPEPGVPSAEDCLPILRTTSDSTTASGWVTRPHARSLPQTPSSPLPRPQDRVARVAVVREKMDDLIVAAKQAEIEIKARGDGRKVGQTPPEKKSDILDFIDPTDIVDLPPQSADSPFAVQASAIYGLGIEQSVGAALLAERLPPSSPGVWSLDTDEESWRRALLHEAVGLSLTSSPAPSTMLQTASPASPLTQTSHSTPPARPRRPTAPAKPGVKRNLGQYIMRPESLERDIEEASQALRDSKVSEVSFFSEQSIPQNQKLPSSQSSSSPRRAETPAIPPHALAPPPRRPPVNLSHSMSHADLQHRGNADMMSEKSLSSPAHSVRKTMSTPLLRDLHEVGVHQGRLIMTPPPFPVRGIHRQTFSATGAASEGEQRSGPPHTIHRAMDSLTSGSQYSLDERDERDETMYGTPVQSDMGRSSMAMSLPSRPSVSSYSQPSPTASAFQDALMETYDGSTMQLRSASSSYETVSTQPAQAVPSYMHGSMSPPPRSSSSLNTTALYPAPRPGFPSPSRSAFHTPYTSQLSFPSSRPSLTSSDPGQSNYVSAVEAVQITEPEPTTPPFPSGPSPLSFAIAERRGRAPTLLSIPTTSISLAIHSALPPASPIAFFDRIQDHHNAMDDLETSDDGETDSACSGPDDDTPSLYLDPPTRSESHATGASPRPSFMRHGNHSTPYVSSTSLHESITSNVANNDRMKPVVNIPPRSPYFKRTRGDQAVSNLYQLAQPESPLAGTSASHAGGKRPTTVGDEEHGERGERDPSLQRLDGLLIQHMETERDTLSRITKTARATRT